jgi:hypothetical protein
VKISGHGIEVDLPDGWDGRIYRRPEGDPTLHAANFPLPAEDGDFGARALGSLGPDGIFIVLTEYRPDLAGEGLFSARGLPDSLQASEFSADALQRPRPGQSGVQRFFTVGRRPFCLYVVVGGRSRIDSRPRVIEANGVLKTVSITPRG